MGRAFAVAGLVLLCAAPLAAAGSATLFPEVAEWAVRGDTAVYGPANLFEYIDGAADNFLAYDFVDLTVRVYEDARKRQLTAEIYRHASPLTAFGIYSSEKPLRGDYLAVGAEGYYEEGVLNFCSGPYYVKLSGFDLGTSDRATLQQFAAAIAARIGGPASLPVELQLLPLAGRQAHSERFVLNDFLGHPFLGSALSADYESAGNKFRLFVMRSADAGAAAARLQRWAQLDKSLAGAPPGDELLLRDPYNGAVRLLRRGPFIAGASGVGDDAWPALRAEFLRLIGDAR